MPPKPKRPCRQPMCSGKTQDPSGYCEQHAHLFSGWNKPGRQTAEARGYGYRWRLIRDRIAERDRHLCVPCLERGHPVPMHSVDHKVPKFEGGTDEDSNLWSLCWACHQTKTQEEARRSRKS